MRLHPDVTRSNSIEAYNKLLDYIKDDKSNCYKFSVYRGSEYKLLIYCKACKKLGREAFYRITPHSIKKGHGCQRCAGNYKYTTEEWVELAKKSDRGSKLLYDRVNYINSDTKIEVGCTKHGYFSVLPVSITRVGGSGCPKCTVTSKKDLQEVKRILHSKYGFKYSIKKGQIYINNRDKLTLYCNEHNITFRKALTHLNRGQVCPLCMRDREVIKSYKKYGSPSFMQKNINHLEQWLNDKFFISISDNGVVKYSTKFLARYFGVNISSVTEKLKNLGIKTRVNKFSELELSIQKYIKILYSKPILINDRDIIKPYELDIVLPKSKLAIECNGNYWHSDIHKPNYYHYDKTIEARKAGYSLFHIWEDQWFNKSKRKIIKSMLKAKLGLIKTKIYARKTVVKELDKTPIQFYKENHLQGSVTSTYSYGLYYLDDLVAVMSFNKSGELVRFCNKINLQVVGGFSKLLSYVIKLKLFNEIISFSDNDYSDGAMYKNNGFTIVKELKQDYFYISRFLDGSFKRHHKFSMRKSKIAKKYGLTIKGKTERELTRELNLLRCYNSGKIKWCIKVYKNN